MTSPFHEASGPQTYGNYNYEWRTLLNTPCYGFSGPNACYSSTCTHSPISSSETEKQLGKAKPPNSSKMSYRSYMNARRLSTNCERTAAATEQITFKSSTHLTVQVNGNGYHKSETYDEYEQQYNGYGFLCIFHINCNALERIQPKEKVEISILIFFFFPLFSFFVLFFRFLCSDIYYDGQSSEGQLFYDDMLPIQTEDFNQIFGSTYYLNNSVYAESNGECSLMSPTRETVVSTKKYTFNPLSEPFHPMGRTYSNSSSPFSRIMTTSSEWSSIASSSGSTTAFGSSTTTIEQFKSGQFVCILCPEKYDTLDELKQHLKSKVEQPHECVICGVSFKHNYLLYRHMKQHRSLRSFRCRCCHKKFRSLNLLGKHFEFCRYKLYIFN